MTPIDHVLGIGRILDQLGVPWVLGGSMASSIVGQPRSTLDIDVAVRLDVARATELVAAVQHDYYASEEMALDAVSHRTSFNLVHYESGFKVDVFVLGDDPLDARQLDRRQRVELEPGVAIWVGSPEDQVLRKLHWFRAGGEVSDRQWSDVLAILAVQGPRIDRLLLVREAHEVGLSDLVARALAALDVVPDATLPADGSSGSVGSGDVS